MSVTVEDGVIRLRGACPVEDAEVLLGALLAEPEALVDWRACEQAHTAVIQVLMAAQPRLAWPPDGPALFWIKALVGSQT